MKNVNLKVDNNILTITIDLSKTHGPSKSGKTTIVGTSEGNQPVPGYENIMIGVNCFKR